MCKNKDQIINVLNPIFHKVFNDKSISISDKTTADDITNWDSMTNIKLVVEIEKKFNIKFTSSEIVNFKNVGDLISFLLKKND